MGKADLITTDSWEPIFAIEFKFV